MPTTRILVVDDDQVDRMACKRALARAEGLGHLEFVEASTAEDALALARTHALDCALLDYRLPDMDGIELMDQLNAPHGDLPLAVVMLTGADDVSVAVEAMRRGASDYLVKDVDGRYQALIPPVVQRVIRERDLRNERARAKQTLHAIISSASDAIISIDGAGRIALFNPSAEQIFGCDALQAIGMPVQVFFQPTGGRVSGRRANGQPVELDVSLSRATVRGHTVLTAIARDVTQRAQAEQALALYRQELTELTRKLMEQEKLTSRRIAQSLHDRLGQTLAALRLSFDALEAAAQHERPATQQRQAERLGRLIDQAVAEVRQTLTALRPPLLEEQGLLAAFDNELRERAGDREDVRLRMEADEVDEGMRWPPDVEYAAFMIGREALANALQHADAALVRLRVSGDGQRLQLQVIDDGRGIEPGVRHGRPGHLGMVGMRERALAIGGSCTVSRGDEGGTVVHLEWEAQR